MSSPRRLPTWSRAGRTTWGSWPGSSPTRCCSPVRVRPPAPTPAYGVHGDHPTDPDRPTVGIVFYRAHALAGNTNFVDVLADAVYKAGGNPLPIFCGSLRG
ncbi:cobaltochelatase subunit CobN [Micromonospora sp. M12]